VRYAADATWRYLSGDTAERGGYQFLIDGAIY